jgi:hypothetical protein
MASDSEPKKIFHLQMLIGEFLNLLDSQINILLQMVACQQFFQFSSKAICSFIIATFPTFSILPEFSVALWV